MLINLSTLLVFLEDARLAQPRYNFGPDYRSPHPACRAGTNICIVP